MGMEIAQELNIVDHGPLFLVFLDLSKAYDTVYRVRLVRTLEGYGAGPCLCELMVKFWVHQNRSPIAPLKLR